MAVVHKSVNCTTDINIKNEQLLYVTLQTVIYLSPTHPLHCRVDKYCSTGFSLYLLIYIEEGAIPGIAVLDVSSEYN
jgi:hypothetical protein